MSAICNYIKPQTLAETLLLLSDNDDAHIISGGTDLLLQIQRERYQNCLLIDINGITELIGISLTKSGLWIGAATKLSEIVSSEQLIGAFKVIGYAASLIGSPQIRNMASIGGNLCNASPSADLSAPLLVLDTQAEITSAKEKRIVPLSEFFIGPSKTIIQAGEMLTALHIPSPEHKAVATYYKHSTRRAMDLAIVGVSALLWRIEDKHYARIGLSAVAPTPIRVYQAEQLISGVKCIDDKLISEIAKLASEACCPINDVRASIEYRQTMVQALIKKALIDVCTQLGLDWELDKWQNQSF